MASLTRQRFKRYSTTKRITAGTLATEFDRTSHLLKISVESGGESWTVELSPEEIAKLRAYLEPVSTAGKTKGTQQR